MSKHLPQMSDSIASVYGRARSWRIVSSASLVTLGSIAVLGGRLVGFLLVASMLGSQEFGVFAVIQSIAALAERVLNAQSWQLLTKRFSQVASTGSTGDRTGILGASILADLFGATLALCVSWLFLLFFGSRFGIDGTTMLAAQVYCTIVFFNAHGTWAGVLRSANRYGLYATYQGVAGCAVVTLIWFAGRNSDTSALPYLLYAWLIGELAAYAFLTSAAFGVLKAQAIGFRDLVTCLKRARNELRSGFGFLLSLNLSGALRVATREGDVLTVGAVLGPQAAGAYKLGRNLASLPLLLTDSLYYLAFPRFTTLFARGDLQGMRRLVKHGCMLGTAMGLVSIAIVFVAGAPFLALISIDDPLVLRTMCICIIATALATATFPFSPALVASGNHKHQVIALLVATAAFFLAAFATMSSLGVEGAAISGIVFYLTWISIVSKRLFIRGALYGNN